jgi:hypothetical protein
MCFILPTLVLFVRLFLNKGRIWYIIHYLRPFTDKIVSFWRRAFSISTRCQEILQLNLFVIFSVTMFFPLLTISSHIMYCRYLFVLTSYIIWYFVPSLFYPYILHHMILCTQLILSEFLSLTPIVSTASSKCQPSVIWPFAQQHNQN